MREPVAFGRYLLLDRLGAGGMAEVFLARVAEDGSSSRLLAVKRMIPRLAEDAELVAMFLDEARIAVQLDHPGVARIEDLGQCDTTYFIAMEYVPGKDLKAVLDLVAAQGETMPVPLASLVAVCVLGALDHAHNRRDQVGRRLGIVHRDVSPKNVLLSFSGGVKLIDFGLAVACERAGCEEPGLLRGKAAYMSPEQARGLPLDGRADVFAAAIVLHEMLTGVGLFAAPSDLLAIERVLFGEVPSPSALNPEVPESLARAILDALNRDASRRTVSAAALADRVMPHVRGAEAKDLARYLAERFPADAALASERGS
ncbi:MAG TPA: serine/threonine-protein kinase [Anaeromyxobacteraceae bacterium]|nr:serine/threonine-protein kinase [Anaeromyxobacteraceae bacterium]